MVNVEAIDRLIDNIENERLKHNQGTWLKNGSTVFEINEADRWSCATSACAAGFTWVAEAPGGSVFDVEEETVFAAEEYDKYRILNREYLTAYAQGDYLRGERFAEEKDKLGVRIDKWAGDVLGLSEEDAETVFFTFDGTDETLRQLRYIRDYGSLMGYITGPDYDDEEESFSYEPDMVRPPF